MKYFMEREQEHLKKLLRIFLDKHEKVKNYYFAPIEFGGEGITIVELK
ncbi:MAG: Smr/MutS family protein [Ignavibacteriales bacterium]|nr:Smr/MutS family protein [Ignavibacteriales bacterium]